MRIASPSRLLTARMDKEVRLKDFLAEGLALPADEPAGVEPVTVLVRSPDSPVARALAATLSETRFSGITVRILIGDTNSDEHGSSALLDIGNAEFRVLADPRFGAAHEQLVAGKTHVWIGDCLRRDPNKRDAFEIFHSNDTAVRLFAAVSFERLWAMGRPVKPVAADAVAPEIIAAGQSGETGLVRNQRH